MKYRRRAGCLPRNVGWGVQLPGAVICDRVCVDVGEMQFAWGCLGDVGSNVAGWVDDGCGCMPVDVRSSHYGVTHQEILDVM